MKDNKEENLFNKLKSTPRGQALLFFGGYFFFFLFIMDCFFAYLFRSRLYS